MFHLSIFKSNIVQVSAVQNARFVEHSGLVLRHPGSGDSHHVRACAG
jgi:hypothetical protein